MKKWAFFLLSLLMVTSAAVFVLRTDWIKNQSRIWLIETFKKQNISLEFAAIDASPPNQIFLSQVSLDFGAMHLSIEKIQLRISLLHLLRRELFLTSFKARNIHWHPLQPETSSSQQEVFSSWETSFREALAFPLVIQRFQLQEVFLQENLPLQMEGGLQLSKEPRLKVQVAPSSTPHASMTLSAHMRSEETSYAKLSGSLAFLSQLFPSQLPQMEGSFFLQAEAPWTSWIQKTGEIEGSFQAKITSSPLLAPWHVLFDSPGSLSGRFQRDFQGFWRILPTLFQNKLLKARLQASLSPSFHLQEALLQAQSDHALSKLSPLQGKVLTHVNIQPQEEGWRVHIGVRSREIHLSNVAIKQVRGSWQGTFQEGLFSGPLSLSGQLHSQPWQVNSLLSFQEEALHLSSIHLQGPQTSLQGDLSYHDHRLWQGSLDLQTQNLQDLPFPENSLFGDAKAHLQLQEAIDTPEQAVQADIQVEGFHLGSFSAHTLLIYADLTEALSAPKGSVYIECEKGKYQDFSCESVELQTYLQEGNCPFYAFVDGQWNTPFEGHLQGFFNKDAEQLSGSITKLEGKLQETPITLENPFSVSYSSSTWQITPCKLALPEGWMEGSAKHSSKYTQFQIQTENIPLELLLPPSTPFSPQGNLTLQASFEQKRGRPKGSLQAQITNLTIQNHSFEKGEGSFTALLEKDLLQWSVELKTPEIPSLKASASLPVQIGLFPQKITWLYPHKTSFDLQYEGRIETLLDEWDWGGSQLEGVVQCHLQASGPLLSPQWKGECLLKEGGYQNYETGTHLQDLSMRWVGKGDRLVLDAFHATDGGKGTLLAEGFIHTHLLQKCPFTIHLHLQDLAAVQTDVLYTQATGTLTLSGTLHEAQLQGALTLHHSALHIPDELPQNLPDLKVVYRNASRPAPSSSPQRSPFPLQLDIHLQTAEDLSIEGRGLFSQWRASLDVKGSPDQPETQGKLGLVSGTFLFSGRSFTLQKGALTFTPQETIPHLRLKGSLEQKGILITASLEGPLTHPQITFQSSPPLPTSSILSYLLFGEDISEITGFEALQLASAMASLSGSQSDVLESTRRSLGIDRLRVISSPGKEGEGETFSVQVGKYIADGVLVSLSQGPDESSTNVSIEVEIKGNFFFQAETLQQEEQGKFSLKWSRNY